METVKGVTPRDLARAFVELDRAAKEHDEPDVRESLDRVAMALVAQSLRRVVVEGESPGPEPLFEHELIALEWRDRLAQEKAEAPVEQGDDENDDEDEGEGEERPTDPRRPVPTHAVIAEVLSELAWFSADSDMNFDVDRLLDNNGVGMVAAIAARRAYHRVGDFWEVVEHLERFFRFAPADPVTSRALAVIDDLRTGRIDPSINDGWLREKLQSELNEMIRGQSTPLAKCVAQVAETACWLHNSELNCVRSVVFDASLIARHLAEGFGESAALEFAHSFELLGREQAGGAR